jgi:peptidoglycan hydrolase-like protein with peptidoglycan-binding domain
MYPGVKSADVTNLQKFLNSQNLLSVDSITGVYGPITTKAVQQFQIKYSITAPGSVATGYGLVGSKTRAKINELGGTYNQSAKLLSEQNLGGQATGTTSMTREQLVAYIKGKIAELQAQLIVLLQELVKAKMAEMGK